MRVLLFYGLLAAVVLLAFTCGRRDECAAALTCALGTALTVLLGDSIEILYEDFDFTLFLIDLGVFAVFLVIALRSTRFWPLWVAGLQLTAMLVHLLKILQPDLMPFVVGVALALWSYPILVVIGIGAWRTRRVEAWREQAQLPDLV